MNSSLKLKKITNKLGSTFELIDHSDFNNLKIRCAIHGEFSITYFNLMQNRNSCPKCGMIKKAENRKISLDDLLKQFRKIHGETYDYSKVNYVKNFQPVTIVCKIHGDFNQTPKHHKKGSGCPKCYLENVNGKFMREDKWRNWASKNMKEFRNSPKYYEILANKYGIINPMQLEKSKKACLNTTLVKYGVKNGFLVGPPDIRLQKIKNTRIANGSWLADKDKPAFYLYTQNVWNYTRKSLLDNPIAAELLLQDRGRETYHIDHVYSIFDGFSNSVDPRIVGHIQNLQRLTASENRKKSVISWITLAELEEKIRIAEEEKLLAKSV